MQLAIERARHGVSSVCGLYPFVTDVRTDNWPKANSMANGKDFFLELRKQVAVLQQGDSIPGG